MAASASGLRVVSLLPSTTEILGWLGLAHRIVGITHECDVCPDDAGMRQLLAGGSCVRLTTSEINPHALRQDQIDAAVKHTLTSGLSLYGLQERLVSPPARLAGLRDGGL